MEIVHEKCQVPHMGPLQPQYYSTSCLDQKKGTRLLHYVLYIPSATQASTHNIATHCTSPWVGGSTAPPSPPTAGPCSGKGAGSLSHKRGVLQSCEAGGRQCCQFTEITQSWIYTSTHSVLNYTILRLLRPIRLQHLWDMMDHIFLVPARLPVGTSRFVQLLTKNTLQTRCWCMTFVVQARIMAKVLSTTRT